ncbi:hypothetical protein ACOSP7_000502 [Xanthoceras sorbifolium]
MVGSESKLESVLSWADEIEIEEEEEEEAAAAQAQSARSKEVLLEEKEINWRKINPDFQSPFRLRQGIRDKKLHIVAISIPPAPVPVIGRKQTSFPNRLNQITMIFVPPLRYPPKTIAGNLFRKFHSLKPKSQIHPHFHQAVHSSQSKSAVFEHCGTKSGMDYSMQAQNNARNSGTPLYHKNQQATPQRKRNYEQNMVGLSPGNERRGHPNRDQKHIRYDNAKSSTRGRAINESSNKGNIMQPLRFEQSEIQKNVATIYC